MSSITKMLYERWANNAADEYKSPFFCGEYHTAFRIGNRYYLKTYGCNIEEISKKEWNRY